MAIYPKAIRKLIAPGSNDPRITAVGVVAHVAVSRADSLYSYFNGPSGGIESHFYIREDGTVEQYRDTAYEADAQGDGNSWPVGSTRLGFISVETEGMGDGSWTDAQLASFDALCRWAAETHGFPLRAVTVPQPRSAAEGGVGYHSQFTAWNPNGHTCPGAARIAQFKTVVLPRLIRPLEVDVTPEDVLAFHFDATNTAWTVESVLRAAYDAGRRNAVEIAALKTSGGVDLDALAAKVAALLEVKPKP